MNVLLVSFLLGFILNFACMADTEPSKDVKEATDKMETTQEQELKIEQTFEGTQSGVNQAKNVVVNKKEDWENLWKEIHSMTLPLPPLPEIDFTKNTVLATFLGQKPTGGYTIVIPKIVKKDKEIIVTLESKEPPKEAMAIQVITAPYYVVVVPKIEDEKMIQWSVARDR